MVKKIKQLKFEYDVGVYKKYFGIMKPKDVIKTFIHNIRFRIMVIKWRIVDFFNGM